MEAKAVSKNVKSSPQKMRRVINQVRGKNVEEAIRTLHFSTQKACDSIEKTIRSAVSNITQHEEGAHIDPADLYIKEIKADEGTVLKRIMPRAMGRAFRILKRSSHLTVVVSTK
jgi:large subunit ribosomal protein L22